MVPRAVHLFNLLSFKQMSTVKVSVLVPIYGVEKFIDKCLHSLFAQTYSDMEYIFVNDCTRDNSIQILEQILKEYPNRQAQVKMITHAINRGLAAARNTALESATGKYIIHVDSDDYLEPDAIRILCDVAEKEKVDVVCFDSYIIYPDKRLEVHKSFASDVTVYVKMLLSKTTNCSLWGNFFTRDLYIRSGVKSVEGLDYGEDFVVTPRLIYHAAKIIKINKCLYNYVQYNTNAYTKNVSIKSFNNMLQAVEILNDYFSRVPDASLYLETLICLKLRVKSHLLKSVGDDLLLNAANLYSDIEKKHIHLLPVRDRILLVLSRHKLFYLLKIYVKYGLIVYQYLKTKKT